MKFVREIPSNHASQCLVKTDDGTKYFIVSSITGELFLSAPETLAFAAKADGTPISMDEVAGGRFTNREAVITELAEKFEGKEPARIAIVANPFTAVLVKHLNTKGRKFR